jgi:hypothetical protein
MNYRKNPDSEEVYHLLGSFRHRRALAISVRTQRTGRFSGRRFPGGDLDIPKWLFRSRRIITALRRWHASRAGWTWTPYQLIIARGSLLGRYRKFIHVGTIDWLKKDMVIRIARVPSPPVDHEAE